MPKTLSTLEKEAQALRGKLIAECVNECFELLVAFMARHPEKDSYTAWLNAPESFAEGLQDAVSRLAEPNFRVQIRYTNSGLAVHLERKLERKNK